MFQLSVLVVATAAAAQVPQVPQVMHLDEMVATHSKLHFENLLQQKVVSILQCRSLLN